MNTSLIKLLISLVVWLVKILAPITSKEREESPEEGIPSPNNKSKRTNQTKVFAPMRMPQSYNQSRVRQTTPQKRTYTDANKIPFSTNVITHEPTATKAYLAARPRPSKKLVQILTRYGSLRQAIVVGELLQHRDF